jgi:hypothetical protein
MGDRKKAGVSILISDKTDFKTKLVRRDKEGHFVLIKGKIHQEKIIIINIYVLNADTPNLTKQTVLNIKAHKKIPT